MFSWLVSVCNNYRIWKCSSSCLQHISIAQSCWNLMSESDYVSTINCHLGFLVLFCTFQYRFQLRFEMQETGYLLILITWMRFSCTRFISMLHPNSLLIWPKWVFFNHSDLALQTPHCLLLIRLSAKDRISPGSVSASGPWYFHAWYCTWTLVHKVSTILHTD